MDVRAGGKGSAWKLCIGSAVVCGVLVFAAGFLHRNAVASAIDEQQSKSAAYVHTKLAPAVGNDKLTKELGDHAAADLKKEVDVPAGAEVRIYALGGAPVFSSGHGGAGDRSAIEAAAGGDVNRVVTDADLAVYAPIENKGGKPIAVAAVVSDIDTVLAEAVGPLDAVRMPLIALGIVLLIVGVALMVRGRSTSTQAPASAKPPKESKKPAKQVEEAPVKPKVSGFDPAPALAVAPQQARADDEPRHNNQTLEVADEPSKPSRARVSLRIGRKERSETPSPSKVEVASGNKAKRSLFGRSKGSSEAAAPIAVDAGPADGTGPAPMTPEREASIRRLLEDQLEQLRTKLQTQEEAAVSANRALQDELDAALRRAHQAEASSAATAEGSTSVGPAERDMIERARGLETELASAKAAAAEAIARADELQRTIDAAGSAGAVAPGSDELRAQLAAAEQGLEDAQRLAAEAEQRAASNESVRGELEVRVAQLGAKAGELEQRATELEGRLQEANAGGDAVRAEIATLTAALGASNARVEELESSSSEAGADDREASTAEIARLRTELANHMERAQSAEDRVATLEADVLAAAAGVAATVDPAEENERDAPAPRSESSTPTVWVAPGSPAPEPKIGAEDMDQPTSDEVRDEVVDEPSSASPSTSPAWVAAEAKEEEPRTSVSADAVDRTPEPNGDGFSAVFAAAFPQDQHTNGREPTIEWEAEAETPAPAADLPQAPVADDRYGDVWSDVEAESDAPTEPAPQPPTQMASSLDEAVGADEEPSERRSEPADAEPSDDGSMSVEDDLWALRARLAHAADEQTEDEPAKEAPRWS